MENRKQISDLIRAGATVIDVRTPAEFAGGACSGSINIPLQEFEKRVQELQPQSTYIVCCASGGRSGTALTFLKSKGFEKVYNAGAWTNAMID